MLFSSLSSNQHSGSKWGKNGCLALGRKRKVSAFLLFTFYCNNSREQGVLVIVLEREPLFYSPLEVCTHTHTHARILFSRKNTPMKLADFYVCYEKVSVINYSFLQTLKHSHLSIWKQFGSCKYVFGVGMHVSPANIKLDFLNLFTFSTNTKHLLCIRYYYRYWGFSAE